MHKLLTQNFLYGVKMIYTFTNSILINILSLCDSCLWPRFFIKVTCRVMSCRLCVVYLYPCFFVNMQFIDLP